MVWFPLIILGVEKLLKQKKPFPLIISVFLAAVSNFYYFYVIALMTLAYIVVRLIVTYRRDIRSILQMLVRIIGSSVLGAVMGGVILLPVCYAFLNDPRMGAGNAWHLVYPLSYYSGLLGTFFCGAGSSYWMCMGYAAPVILAIFLLFMRKRQFLLLKICFIVCLAIILIPALGQLLNGMSYMANKWCWAFALLCAYIFAVMWPKLMNLKFREATKLAIALSICFFTLLMLEYSRTTAVIACVGVAFIFLFVIFPFRMENPRSELLWKKRKQAVALILVIIAVANVSFFWNASSAGDYAKQAMETDEVAKQLMLTEAKAVQQAAYSDDITGFYRYSGRSLTRNAGILTGLSGTQYFWTISNPGISDYMREMELLETVPQMHWGFDDRSALLTLSSVLYYVLPSGDNDPLPYGFTYVDEFNVKEDITEDAVAFLREELGTDELTEAQVKVIEEATASRYKIYRNENALPFAYVYDNIISEDTWDTLSAVEKQEAMLRSVVLANYDGETREDNIEYSSQSLDYSIEYDSAGVTLEDYGFVVTTAGSSVTFSFEGLENSETYFNIEGLGFDGVSTYDLYFGDEKYDPLNLFTETRWNLLSYADRESAKKNDLFWTEATRADLTLKTSSGVSKTIDYRTENHTYYNNRHDFTVNLDYSEDAVTSVTITFSEVGVYSFDSIEIICQPMDRYVAQVSKLKERTLENTEIGTDLVTGTISLDEPGVLCLSIPYSVGWSAYVDGKEATLYQANIKNMALALEAGDHDIRLVYHTPYLRVGAVISVIGFFGFGVLIFRTKQKKGKGKLL